MEYLPYFRCLILQTNKILLQMKKNVLMQILSFTVLFAFLCMPVNTNAQGSKANFAGKWAFNAEKSDMGQPPQGGGGGGQRMGGGDFTATQDANLLTVERTRTGQDGQTTTTTMKYTLDGKDSVNTTGRGESKSTATWSADGKSLTIVTTSTFERDGQTTEMKSNAVWTLTSPTVLTVVTTMNTPNGERKTTAVYDKK
jgi:Tol biopolymer transport system component